MKATLIVYGGILLVIAIFAVGIPHIDQYDGQGRVNVFPDGSTSKKYQLDADISVSSHRQGWFHRYSDYTVTNATWPDGGQLSFTGDYIVREKLASSCTSSEGKQYNVQVSTAPEEPQADSNN